MDKILFVLDKNGLILYLSLLLVVVYTATCYF